MSETRDPRTPKIHPDSAAPVIPKVGVAGEEQKAPQPPAIERKKRKSTTTSHDRAKGEDIPPLVLFPPTPEEAGEQVSDEEVESGKLRLTNGYPIKFDQLARLLALATRDSRARTPTRELAAVLGVADSHMTFLRLVSQALGLTQANIFKTTALGTLIAAHDPFFDDIGTLWFLHYLIASEPRYIVWNRFANVIMPTQHAFTLKELRATFEDLRLVFAANSCARYVPAETRSILDAYTSQQFSRLAYLRATADGYAPGFRQPVPLPVLAASIARYRDRHQPNHTAVSVRDLLAAPNSPGVVFALPENTLRAGLEQLRHGHGFSLETRGDLDQVRFAEDIPEADRLERYYAGR